MTTNQHFEIFKKRNDVFKWEKYLEYIKYNTEFDDDRKNHLIQIYTFLKRELGKDYIGRCQIDGNNLVNCWICGKGWYYSEMTWLYNALQFFKANESNYEQVLGRLRSDIECNNQGIPFLIAGDSLRKAGFEIIFEPNVEFAKKPDLKITNPVNDEIIFCEISKLNESDPRQNSSYTYHILFDIFTIMIPVIPFAGKVFRNIDNNEERVGLRNLLKRKKEKAYNENLFIEINLLETNGILDCAIAHPDRISVVKEWEQKRKYMGVNQIKGLPLNFDETPRIKYKIAKEASQLPENYPGVVYVPVIPLYFMLVSDYNAVIEQIGTSLAQFPHLVGICLYAHLGNHQKFEPITIIEIDFFQRKTIHRDTQQDILFILNQNFSKNLSPDTLLKLYNSFQSIFQ